MANLFETRVMSRSDPTKSHLVTIDAGGRALCECWQFRTQHNCYHTESALDRWHAEGNRPRMAVATGMILGRADQDAWEIARFGRVQSHGLGGN